MFPDTGSICLVHIAAFRTEVSSSRFVHRTICAYFWAFSLVFGLFAQADAARTQPGRSQDEARMKPG